MNIRKRVVITGLGVLSPNGVGRAAYWAALADGVSGIRPITLFDPSPFPCRVAGEVPGTAWLDALDRRETRRMARFTLFALAAARMAVADAGLPERLGAVEDRAGVVIGVSTSALDLIEREHRRFLKRGHGAVSPYGVSAAAPNAAAVGIASFLEISGYKHTVANDCTSGLDTVGTAFEQISRGELSLALCGGVDAPITPLLWGGYCQGGLVPVEGEVDAGASCPFDRRRTVGLISEGAAILVLEERARALARGVRPYGEITGYGAYSSASAALGLERAMRRALTRAEIAPGEVEHVSAHGPSHLELDREETRALKALFGRRAHLVPVTSIKSMIGNPFTAGGALQVAAALLSFREGVIPPTINYRDPDPDCDLDYVPNHARHNEVDTILVNSHGMGGGNVSLVLKKCHT